MDEQLQAQQDGTAQPSGQRDDGPSPAAEPGFAQAFLAGAMDVRMGALAHDQYYQELHYNGGEKADEAWKTNFIGWVSTTCNHAQRTTQYLPAGGTVDADAFDRFHRWIWEDTALFTRVFQDSLHVQEGGTEEDGKWTDFLRRSLNDQQIAQAEDFALKAAFTVPDTCVFLPFTILRVDTESAVTLCLYAVHFKLVLAPVADIKRFEYAVNSGILAQEGMQPYQRDYVPVEPWLASMTSPAPKRGG